MKIKFYSPIFLWSFVFASSVEAKEYLLELASDQSLSQMNVLNSTYSVQKHFEAFGKEYLLVKTSDDLNALSVMSNLHSMGFAKVEENHTYHLLAGSKPPAPPQDLRDFNPQPVLPNDKHFTQLWGMLNYGQRLEKGKEKSDAGVRKMDSSAAQAWTHYRGTRNMVVGIMDTGVDYNHEDLMANLWSRRDAQGRVSYGYNAIQQSNDVMDGHGHGTHVAGTIGAVGNNGVGVAGVNWEVSMASVQIFDARGLTTSEAILRGLDWFYQQRNTIKLINHSWGGTAYSAIVDEAFKALDRAGVVNVIAAGNNGRRMGTHNGQTFTFYPAMYDLDHSIVVAAHDNKGQRAVFSNYSDTYVDLVAPGDDIYSTVPKNLYSFKSGTSMAAPHVAGAVALYWGRNPSLSAAQVKRHVINAGQNTSSLQGVSRGAKRLNVLNLFN